MIEIAKILKPQGIKGELKVQLFSDNFDDFCQRGFAYIKQGKEFSRIAYEAVRTNPPYVYLRMENIATRNDAERISGVFLYIEREQFGELGKEEYYVCDLIGLSIIDEKGEKLGVLKEVLQHGAADVYVVTANIGFMFPALKRVIERIDIKKEVIVVNSKALDEVCVYDV